MRATELPIGPLLGVVLLGLTAYAGLVASAGGLGVGRQIITASLRAVAQLAVVAGVLVAVLDPGWLTAAFIALMYAVASATAVRRVKAERRGWWTAAAAIGAGVARARRHPALRLDTAPARVGLARRRHPHRWGDDRHLALRPPYGGGTPHPVRRVRSGVGAGTAARQAALEVCRSAAPLALVPALDQTRTVGLVTLPGAFIGVLLGGGNALPGRSDPGPRADRPAGCRSGRRSGHSAPGSGRAGRARSPRD